MGQGDVTPASTRLGRAIPFSKPSLHPGSWKHHLLRAPRAEAWGIKGGMSQCRSSGSVQGAPCKEQWDGERAPELPGTGWEELAGNRSWAGRRVPKKAPGSRQGSQMPGRWVLTRWIRPQAPSSCSSIILDTLPSWLWEISSTARGKKSPGN